jgi:SAM-dependent methyltransferase
MGIFSRLRAWLHAWSAPPESSAPPTPPAPLPAVDSRDCGLVDAVMRGWYQNDSGELLRGFVLGPEDTVLDFGCGEGGAALFAARQGSTVIFADVEADKITALEARMQHTGARACRGIVCGDLSAGARLPLADASVNRIIAMEVLEHVPDPARVMAELVRIAAPGAQFLVSVPDPAGERIQQAVAPAAHFQPPNHIHIFERADFTRLIEAAGLHIEQRHHSGFYWSLWMGLYWATQPAAHADHHATRDTIAPPYPPLLDQWAATWHTLLDTPQGTALQTALDDLMPKSQTLIARKPFSSPPADT